MPDDFVRDGRHLRDWLPDLLGPDPATRRRAENVVCAMKWGAPVADATVHRHRPADFPAHLQAWAAAITSAVNDPAFGGEAFVRAALDRMRADAATRREQHQLRDRLMDAAVSSAVDAAPAPPLTSAEKAAMNERIRQLVADEKTGRLPNSSGTHTLHLVIEHAGPVLLRVPDAVREGLRDGVCGRALAAALAELGPAAVAFAPDLMAGTDSYYGEPTIPYGNALAAVAREDASTVASLRDRVRTGPRRLSFDAAGVLAKIGPTAVALVPSLVNDLLAVADARPADGGVHLLPCLAKLAPGRSDVFDRAAAAARPAPPQLRPFEGHPEYQYDAVMYARGSALDALGHMLPFAAKAIPILADAMDTFEEYDPGWGYERGDHGRVIDGLMRLAPAAPAAVVALAVPALARHLRGRDGEMDSWIVKTLGRLGPIAASAAPALQAIRDAEPPAKPTDPEFAEYTDPVAWALRQISGMA